MIAPVANPVCNGESSDVDHTISSSYWRKVFKTKDIAGRLPNTVFTLPPHLIHAIVCCADVNDASRAAMFAICQKFFIAEREYQTNKRSFANGLTLITLDCGRLYAEGHNVDGQCGVGESVERIDVPRLVRIPPVLQVWHSESSWFANTTCGLYAWGLNGGARLLGVSENFCVYKPHRVPIEGVVTDVYPHKRLTMVRTKAGWSATGCVCQPWSTSSDTFHSPEPIPNSQYIERIAITNGKMAATFIWTAAGLRAGGYNYHGTCRVGSTDDEVSTFTPVALPAGTRVFQVTGDDMASYIFTDRGCFTTDSTTGGLTGPVDMDVATSGHFTVTRTDDTLMAYGDNMMCLLTSTKTGSYSAPGVPLSLPGPVTALLVDFAHIFVRLVDGTWVGRGYYERDKYFVQVHDDDLVETRASGDTMSCLTSWTQVKEEFVKFLEARLEEAGPNTMTLFTPATATEYEPVARVLADGEALETVDAGHGVTMVRTAAGWGRRRGGQTVVPIPGSAGIDVDRWETQADLIFAHTRHGILCCGPNHLGQCGVGIESLYQASLAPVLLSVPVTEIHAFRGYFNSRTMFRTTDGWLASGAIETLVRARSDRPVVIPGTEGVTRWKCGQDVAFAWTKNGLLACGDNEYGQVGVGSNARRVPLTPVALPDDVKDRVDMVIVDDYDSVFFRSGRRCFTAGKNSDGELGPRVNPIWTPIELPFPVDQIQFDSFKGVIVRSGDALFTAGRNSPDESSNSFVEVDPDTTFTRVALPAPVDRCLYHKWWKNVGTDYEFCTDLHVRLTDGGVWVGFYNCPVEGFFWAVAPEKLARQLDEADAMVLDHPIGPAGQGAEWLPVLTCGVS